MSLPRPHSLKRWWKEATVYQIYPASFSDSNGDGVGDIPGIIARLDYLRGLGVDVIWLSPVYKSPGKDMGYDISDYRAIDPRFGTMADMDALIAGAHARGIRVLMDLVVNHTSDQHEWFLESRSSRSSPKRHWYVWRDPKYDSQGNRQPPNNWLAVFGGSTWEWDELTGQYYLHCFLPGQPDLDWEHAPVRAAVHDIMAFWLDKRVDGFRADVINMISKAPGLPDAPVVLPGQRLQPAHSLFANGPRLHEFLRGLRSAVLSRYDCMVVGEMPWLSDRDQVLKVVGEARGELDMIFQFDIVEMDFGPDGRYSVPAKSWDLSTLKGIVDDWQSFMVSHDGWYSICIESHDQPRSVSRFVDRALTDDDTLVRTRVAKMLATLCAGQSGTLYLYQGQELGLKNMPRSWGIEEYKDIESLNAYQLAKESGDKQVLEEFLKQLHLKARDHSRAPMQWDSTKHSGFTTGEPWMRVVDDYAVWNAAAQVADDDSVHAHWKRILALRKRFNDPLVYGDFEMLSKSHPAVVAYRRRGGSSHQQALVVINFTPQETVWVPPQDGGGASGRGGVAELVREEFVRLKNYDDVLLPGGGGGEGGLKLRAFEALMFVGGE